MYLLGLLNIMLLKYTRQDRAAINYITYTHSPIKIVNNYNVISILRTMYKINRKIFNE